MFMGLSMGINRPDLFLPNATPVVGVIYDYANTGNQFPAQGQIFTQNPSLQIRCNNVDSNGVNHDGVFSNIGIGDIVTIGTQSANVVGPPGRNGNVWTISVDVWPLLADGTYTVTIFGPF